MQDPGKMSSPFEEEGIPEVDDRTSEIEEFPLPRDFPQGVEEYGLIAEDQRRDEPLTDRLSRELPDEPPRESDALEGRLHEPDSDVEEVDQTAEAVAVEAEEDEVYGLTAEEAAIHVEPE